MTPNPAVLAHVTRSPRSTTEIGRRCGLSAQDVGRHLLRCYTHGLVERSVRPVRYWLPAAFVRAPAPGHSPLVKAARRARALVFLRAHPDATFMQVLAELRVDHTTARRLLRRLEAEGVVGPRPRLPLSERLPPKPTQVHPSRPREEGRALILATVEAHPGASRKRLRALLPALSVAYIKLLTNDLLAAGRIRGVTREGRLSHRYFVEADAMAAK